ncbi:MAG: hypothetical protein IAE80_19455 [Anaerolinea sp.]|nr:hypothetical protein [Anaerolinea sp.]
MPEVRLNVWFAGVLPKAGSTPDECADAVGFNLETGTFAVADGATISTLPEIWSRLLVEHFCQSELPPILSGQQTRKQIEQWLAQPREQWALRATALLPDLSPIAKLRIGNNLRARRGAASTLLGLKIHVDGKGRAVWHAGAVGDSCLFWLTTAKPDGVFPVTSARQFNNAPATFHSFDTGGSPVASTRFGYVGDEDLFIMATDALAHWLMLRWERQHDIRAFEPVLYIRTHEHFDAFISGARADPSAPLADDDAALILLHLERKR